MKYWLFENTNKLLGCLRFRLFKKYCIIYSTPTGLWEGNIISFGAIRLILFGVLFKIEVYLTYNIILVSGVQYNDSIFVDVAKWSPQ